MRGMADTPPVALGGVTPIFRVADLAASLEYYVAALGFLVQWQQPARFACVAPHGVEPTRPPPLG